MDAVINLFKIFFNGHGSIQCLIKYLQILVKVYFCNFPISVHYMVDQIYCIDSNEPCVFVAEFCNISVFNGFNYLVLKGIVHGGGSFENLAYFSICLIVLLTVSYCGIFSDGWDCTRNVRVFPWFSRSQYGLLGVLHD